MGRKSVRLILALVVVCLAVACLVWYQNGRHAPIEEWSGSVVPEGFDWAEASSGYGVEKKSYLLTDDDLEILTNLLHQVTEENCSRKTPKDADRIDCRLSLEYEGKLWLFHCLSNGMVRIVFEDPETAAYYGCDDSRLYVEQTDLHNFIVELVTERAQ